MSTPRHTTADRPLDAEAAFLSQRSHGFVELLAFEAQNVDLFDARLPVSGVPYWSIVRFTVARLIGDALFGTRTVLPARAVSSRASTARFLGRCVISHPWRARRDCSRVLMFSSAIGNSRRPGGRYFNRLSDYFASVFPAATTLLESPYGRQYFFPREFPNVYCLAGVNILARLASPLQRQSAADDARIRGFLDLLREPFSRWLNEDQWRQLHSTLRAYVSSDASLFRIYDKLLARLSPQLLMIEDGCYGHWGPLIASARHRGIHVAEYQHGLVSRNHEAYNYLPAVQPKVRDVLPDTFLAYGRYWADQISIPSAMRVIGNPHLSASRLYESSVPAAGAGECLMLVAGGLDPGDYRKIVSEFLDSAPPSWRVIIRPHPGRRAPAAEDYSLFAGSTRVKLDLSDDYYLSLREADVIAGDASTAVMEAVAFDKRVFLIDHIEVQRNYPGMFPTFEDGAGLFALVCEAGAQLDLPAVEEIWARDWQASYSSFVESVTGRGGLE